MVTFTGAGRVQDLIDTDDESTHLDREEYMDIHAEVIRELATRINEIDESVAGIITDVIHPMRDVLKNSEERFDKIAQGLAIFAQVQQTLMHIVIQMYEKVHGQPLTQAQFHDLMETVARVGGGAELVQAVTGSSSTSGDSDMHTD